LAAPLLNWENAMPFVPAADTCQIEAVYEWDGQIVENVFHYRFTAGSPTETDVGSLADVVRAYIHDEILPLAADTLTFLRLVAKMIDVIDGILVVNTTGLPASGGGGSDALPNNVTATFSWRTGLSGRSRRGRSYLLGLQEGQVTANALSPAAVTAYTEAWEGLRLVASEDGWEMVVVSKFSGGAPRVAAVVTPITTGFFVDSTIDSQRRRLPGRGS
jgi:hypothetical protein